MIGKQTEQIFTLNTWHVLSSETVQMIVSFPFMNTSISKIKSYALQLSLQIYSMAVQLIHQLPFTSIPHIHTSIETRSDQNHFIRMPFHSHNASVVLQLQSNPIGRVVINNHRRVHRSRRNPAVHRIERHSTCHNLLLATLPRNSSLLRPC